MRTEENIRERRLIYLYQQNRLEYQKKNIDILKKGDFIFMIQRLFVKFGKDKEHIQIYCIQYVSLNGVLKIKEDAIKEQKLLNEQINSLLEENKAYRTLLKEQLNMGVEEQM